MSVRRALVLSGGGARGAYEAGVLRFIFERLPGELGHPVRLDILAGTSVGAINASYMAATADESAHRVARLEAIWRSLRAEELVKVSAGSVLRVINLPSALQRLFGARRASGVGSDPGWAAGLMDTGALEALIRRSVPWSRIRANLEAGRVDALCMTATEVATGRAIVFIESRHGHPPHWTPDPTIVARSVRLGPEHALASAAVPLLFPWVKLGGFPYVDGSLRLNTPLVPALRLGADRLLVVAVGSDHAATVADGKRSAIESTSSSFLMLGGLLNALVANQLHADIGRLRFVNEVLLRGERTFGPGYLKRFNEAAEREGGQPLKVVRDAVIRPSQDLGRTAAQALRKLDRQGRIPYTLRWLSGGSRADSDFAGDLLSYILFDSEYTAALCDLGYADASKQEAVLVDFFSDEPKREPAGA